MAARRIPALLLCAGLSVVSGLACSPARAERDCGDESTQRAMEACVDAEYRRADARLNAVYRELIGKLGAEERAALRDAERAWIEYRDNECNAEASRNAGGSIQATVIGMCLVRMTRTRIRELQDQLDCSEGDASCADD